MPLIVYYLFGVHWHAQVTFKHIRLPHIVHVPTLCCPYTLENRSIGVVGSMFWSRQEICNQNPTVFSATTTCLPTTICCKQTCALLFIHRRVLCNFCEQDLVVLLLDCSIAAPLSQIFTFHAKVDLGKSMSNMRKQS